MPDNRYPLLTMRGAILLAIADTPQTSYEALMERFKLCRRAVVGHVQQLLEMGLIVKEQARRGGEAFWSLAPGVDVLEVLRHELP